MSEKLTAIIPCKNERWNIRPCIECLKPLADEILVADNGSTDGTLDIVDQIGGCRVINREYVNCADFKNWAIPQAKHPWVLVVDADERVTPELAQEIYEILANPPAGKDGYWIDRANHYLGYRIKHCGWNSDAVIRLFRRECRYQTTGLNVEHSEIDLPAARLGHLKQPFLHYTTWTTDHYVHKHIRYAHFGVVNFEERGKRPSVFSLLTRAPIRFFQLYVLRLGFLDGLPGFQVCMHTAYYSFLKQAKHWELHYGTPQPDPEGQRVASDDDQNRILPFSPAENGVETRHVARQRRAA